MTKIIVTEGSTLKDVEKLVAQLIYDNGEKTFVHRFDFELDPIVIEAEETPAESLRRAKRQQGDGGVGLHVRPSGEVNSDPYRHEEPPVKHKEPEVKREDVFVDPKVEAKKK